MSVSAAIPTTGQDDQQLGCGTQRASWLVTPISASWLPQTTRVILATAQQPQQPASQQAYGAAVLAGQPATLHRDIELPLNVMLRCSFFCGICDEFLPKRVFAEQQLTFASSLGIVIRAESALNQQRNIKNKKVLQIDKTVATKMLRDARNISAISVQVGMTHWDAHSNTVCSYFRKVRHIEKACIAKKNNA